MWSSWVLAVWAGDTSGLLKAQGCHCGSYNPKDGNVTVTTVKPVPSSPSALLSLVFTAPQMWKGPAAHAFIIRPSMQHIKFCSLIPNLTFVLFIKHSLWGIAMRILGFANLIFLSSTLSLLISTILDNGLTLLFFFFLETWNRNLSSLCSHLL